MLGFPPLDSLSSISLFANNDTGPMLHVLIPIIYQTIIIIIKTNPRSLESIQKYLGAS